MHLGFHVIKSGRHRACVIAHDNDDSDMDSSLVDSCKCAVEQMREIGITHPCVQIFVMGPRNSTVTQEIDQLKAFAAHTRVIIHSAYISAPWSGNTYLLRQQLRIASDIRAHGVVVHLGKGVSAETIAKVFDGLELANSQRIWLEINSAKPSEHTFETPEKLHALFSQLDPTQVGLCIDTAHLFACGVSLASREAAETWLRSVQFLMPKVPKMVHLNDTSTTLGSGRDIHENLLTGNIWGPYRKRVAASGIVAIVEWCKRYSYDIIVERHNDNPLVDVELVFGI